MRITKFFSKSTRGVTFGLSIIQLFKAFLSFFTVIVSSSYFGTSIGRDVWLLSLSIISIIGAILFGPVFATFRAKYIMIKEAEGDDLALKTAYSLLFYLISFSILIVIITEIIPFVLGKSFAPSYNGEQQKALSLMLRFVAPTLLFSIMVSILTGLLNVYKIFYVPELMDIFSSFLNVIIILLFAPKYGIYSLVISTYLSNTILLSVLFIVIKKNNIRLIQNFNLDFGYTIRFFKFALPFYFNYFIAQVLLAAERIITTFLGVGNLSVLDYARKFVSIPIGVIQSTVNIVLTSNLTKIYIEEGENIFIVELNKFIDTILLLTLPLITLFVICPSEVVRIFLLRGAFDPKFLLPTSKALFWFGLGIVSIIFYSTNSQALVAQGKNKITAVISAAMGFLVLLINLLFYKKYGVQVLAFSWSIIHFVGGTIMYFIISFNESKTLLKEFIRKLALLFIVMILCYGLYSIIFQLLHIEKVILKSMLTVGIIGSFSIAMELLFVYILGFKEKEFIISALRKK
jgi:putative peptidoglycan lipid II flippase